MRMDEEGRGGLRTISYDTEEDSAPAVSRDKPEICPGLHGTRLYNEHIPKALREMMISYAIAQTSQR